MNGDYRIELNRAVVVRALGASAFFLVLASTAGQLVRLFTGHDSIYGIIPLFDLDAEANIPTYFSASLLLSAALFLSIISTLKRKARAPYASNWTILAFIFLYLAVDEAARLHDLMTRPLRELLSDRATGIFYFTWVIPGLALTFVLGVFFLRFMLHLPAQTRSSFVIAGVLYIAGAIGLEMIGGRYAEQRGLDDLTYTMITTLEESLEMAGSIIFVRGLMVYVAITYRDVCFRFHKA
ncbi:MAG TPA: hypothetical protein VNO43_16315 [Candidatus Eisenbacteria bacterium]|nr:hypothetical protein [Candidatus Eisenbacteria bacterium]